MLENDSVSPTLAERRAEATREGVIEAAWTLSRSLGLTGWSMRELAKAVGIKAPTLYAYFDSKDAIYDAMFRQSYEQKGSSGDAEPYLAAHGERDAFKLAAHDFFDFCTDDPTRYQLMFQRTIPGFEPSEQAYAASQRSYERFAQQLAAVGVADQAHLDLWTAMISGLTAQQISNDPTGDRWRALVDTAVDLFCDHVGIPPTGDQNP
ncbi:MAG: TetR/AcrR family transcriptional regulator [Acidimicrobiia bacterium]|nr:TetR/AcrR family transcriptional regulator [Acidimicrobiia bacterium]